MDQVGRPQHLFAGEHSTASSSSKHCCLKVASSAAAPAIAIAALEAEGYSDCSKFKRRNQPCTGSAASSRVPEVVRAKGLPEHCWS